MLKFITGNQKKFEEIQALIPDIEQVTLDVPELQEIDSKAILAAKLQAAKKQYPNDSFIIDDTSLHLSCLNGFPGPLIKWLLNSIGPRGITELVHNYPDHKAIAQASIGYCDKAADMHFFVGTCEGTIVEAQGNDTFGWDPIFKPQGSKKTFAQMSAQEKNSISHRGKAIHQLAEYLQTQ